MRDIAITWVSIKNLYRDLRKARHFTSSSLEWSPDNSLAVKTKFLNIDKRSQIEVEFHFSTTNGLVLYPYGQWGMDIKVNCGDADATLLKEHTLKIESGPDLLARACKLLQETL